VSHVDTEIASQPACWRSAIALAADARGLPKPGERVAVIGCGTSLFMGQAYAVRREESGKGETDAFAASEFPAGRRYDRIVALSRSGTTTEVLTALGQVPAGTPTVALTADPRTPVGRAATETVVLDFADEESVVQTRFATSSLVLLRAHLGDDVAALAGQAEQAVGGPLPDAAIGARQFTFLGQGWTVGLANEAALKLREASNSWTESYPAMEYRHGPISITDGGSCVWVFGPPPGGLADDVARTGATFVVSDLDPLADLIRAQRLAVALAAAKGLDPDQPRNLSRSVILPASPA
jgi:fructoselysine-6-P-deglycase FrlB-like protein